MSRDREISRNSYSLPVYLRTNKITQNLTFTVGLILLVTGYMRNSVVKWYSARKTRRAAAGVAMDPFIGGYSREALQTTVFPDAMTERLIPNRIHTIKHRLQPPTPALQPHGALRWEQRHLAVDTNFLWSNNVTAAG